MYKKFEMELAGRTLRVDVDRVAKQANGAVLMHYGDTTVLCTATASDKPREGIDFFPLSVEYNERMYAVGKIPGGFNKREGKASENAILTDRAFSSQTFPQFSFQFPYPAFSNDTPADELHLLCLLFQAVPQVRRSEDSFSLSISVPEDLFLSYLSTSQQTAFPVCPDIEMPDPSASFHKVPSLLMQYYKKFPKAEVLHTVIRLLFVL